MNKTNETNYQVERIVAKKIIKEKVFYKVKWVGYHSSLNTYQPTENLQNAKQAVKKFEKQNIKNSKKIKKATTKARITNKSIKNKNKRTQRRKYIKKPKHLYFKPLFNGNLLIRIQTSQSFRSPHWVLGNHVQKILRLRDQDKYYVMWDNGSYSTILEQTLKKKQPKLFFQYKEKKDRKRLIQAL